MKWIEHTYISKDERRKSFPWISRVKIPAVKNAESSLHENSHSEASTELELIKIPELTYKPEIKPVIIEIPVPEYSEGNDPGEAESGSQGFLAYKYNPSDYSAPQPPKGVETNRLHFYDKQLNVVTAIKLSDSPDRSSRFVPSDSPAIDISSQSISVTDASEKKPAAEKEAANDNRRMLTDSGYVFREEFSDITEEHAAESFHDISIKSSLSDEIEPEDSAIEENFSSAESPAEVNETYIPDNSAEEDTAACSEKDSEDEAGLDEDELEEENSAAAADEASKIFNEIPINEDYIFPSSYLNTTKKMDSESWKSEILRNSELLVKTLADFSIESKVSCVNRGPVVTLYEMTLAPGIKVTRIVSLADDIAMALAAARVRVVAPIPGKSAIGIEVPNSIREMVTLGDIIGTPEYNSADMILKIAMGKDILGKPCMLDLKKQPHLLIAGATGAGKSVCVNGVITSLVFNYDPNHVRFILIDPKMVELQLYNGLPHLLTPVITDPDECPKALKWAILEMERRYRLLSEQCVRDIDRYNQKIRSYKHPEEYERLPYIVIIIDEFADLMMVAPKEVESYVTRIAQKARAIGIHLVLATQRPSVDIITGIIKANFPARVAFQVAQKTDSRTILDQNGAEKLLGKGDMLYQSPTSSFPVRIQGAYISEEEIMQIVQKACKYARPRYIDFEELLKQNSLIDDESGDIEDEMFAMGLKIIEETKKASASYLQRRLSIGYNRAARMIERMEELGYVGPQMGSKPREVYV